MSLAITRLLRRRYRGFSRSWRPVPLCGRGYAFIAAAMFKSMASLRSNIGLFTIFEAGLLENVEIQKKQYRPRT